MTDVHLEEEKDQQSDDDEHVMTIDDYILFYQSHKVVYFKEISTKYNKPEYSLIQYDREQNNGPNLRDIQLNETDLQYYYQLCILMLLLRLFIGFQGKDINSELLNQLPMELRHLLFEKYESEHKANDIKRLKQYHEDPHQFSEQQLLQHYDHTKNYSKV